MDREAQLFQCMKRIYNKVQDETEIKLMNKVIENYLRTGETDIAEPYASLMKEAAASYEKSQTEFEKQKNPVDMAVMRILWIICYGIMKGNRH